MRDIPTIFSAPMIRSLLDERKTQTRRILRAQVPPPPDANCHPRHKPKHPAPYLDAYCSKPHTALNPRGMSNQWCWWQVDDRQCLPTFKVPFVPGDRLWVRENFATSDAYADSGILGVEYAADGATLAYANGELHHKEHGCAQYTGPWKPSIHMPRWASRITLVVEGVKVERLQDISEEDARAEGAEPCANGWWFDRNPLLAGSDARGAFYCLWSSIHGADAWDANPYVVAPSFAVHRTNIDLLNGEAAHG
ncbi:Phage protein [Azospirillum argentinense]|uniref:hypothetical protein n=1 Tax=Azospirillum argentinense TaxID=2970906 RepID=UPI0032DE986E